MILSLSLWARSLAASRALVADTGSVDEAFIEAVAVPPTGDETLRHQERRSEPPWSHLHSTHQGGL